MMKAILRIFILVVLLGFMCGMKPPAKLTIYVFLQADCPCVYSHKDSFGLILRKYANSINFQMIFVGKDDTKDKIENLLKQLDWKVVYKKDQGLKLTKQFNPKVSTDCVVLDASNHLLYQGAIDDAIKNMGMIKRFYLKEVIDAALQKKRIPYNNVPGTGCSLM
jgi:hypothetical protein